VRRATAGSRLAALAVVAAAVGAGCGTPGIGPQMRPGESCLACHGGGRAQTWTLAGTLYSRPDATVDEGLDGASVLVTDAVGRSYTLWTNGAGNFYTAEALEFPVEVAVQKDGVEVAMAVTATVGDCNSCHSQPPANSAPGRLYLPLP
jgi:hypothetical protein